MPKFTVQQPRRAAVALEEEQVLEDIEVSLQMFLDQSRTGDVAQLVAIDGDVTWAWKATAAGGRGAVLLVNNDDDDNKRSRDCDDNKVNSNTDKLDLAPLYIRFRGVDKIPGTWKAWLKVDQPDRIRIFKSDAGDAVEIIGPTTAGEYELTDDDRAASEGAGTLKLAMEALSYAGPGFEQGLIKLSFKVKGTGGVEKTDSAEARVAPWMIPHHGLAATRVYVANCEGRNRRFRDELNVIVRAGGCSFREFKPATESTPKDSEELLDLGDCYGMDDLLSERDNAARIFQRACITVPVNYYYDEREMTMHELSGHFTTFMDGPPMTRGELLDFKGGSPETNRAYLARKGSPSKGWIKVPAFYYVTDVRAAALRRLASNFDDISLQRLLEMKHGGRTNADRLLKPNQRLSLPERDDRWMQDCMEIGYSSLPGRKIDAVMRASRNRPLRSIAPSLLGQELGYHAPGKPWRATTFDSNGNLEVTPPCTSQAGKEYPWGRIYYGPGRPHEEHDPDIKTFFERQVVQEPIELDTAWLRVGHVDEMISWVPATPAVRAGFPYKLLIASPRRALKILDDHRGAGAQGGMLHRPAKALTLDGRNVACASIDDFFTRGLGSHADFRAWNNDVQAKLDAVLTKLKTETGVQDNEIIHVPILYEQNDDGTYDAITACTVNMLVINRHCVIPMPFGPIVGGVDLFQQELNGALTPIGLTPHFIDDWDEYHDKKGEVHCGTNTLRTPPAANWWEFDG